MSIKVMSAVWEVAEVRGDRLLILLALADYASDDGYCWPKVKTLALKTRVSERWVQTALREFVSAGVLEVVEEGGGRGRAALYRLTIADELHPFPETVKRVNSDAERVHSVTERVNSVPRIYNIEPSKEPSKNRKAINSSDDIEWLKRRYEKGKARHP